MDVFTGVMLASLALYVAIGNYAGRKVKHLEDYFVAGRRVPTLFIIGTLVASILSSNTFLGDAGVNYGGAAGLFLIGPPTAYAGFVVGAVWFGRYLRRSRCLTVAEFFGKRFSSQRLQTLAGLTVVFGLGGYLLAVTQGAAMILSSITHFPYWVAVVLAWFSYTIFTFYSGSRGVVITDTLMFLLFAFVAIAALAYIWNLVGGLPGAMSALVNVEGKEGMMSWHATLRPDTMWETKADTIAFRIISGFAWGVAWAVSPWQSSRYLMAKNEHVVTRSGVAAFIIVWMLQAIVWTGATLINVINPDIEPHDQVMIWTALNVLPALMGALLLAGIMAAALSSASTFLSLVGFSISYDVGARKNTDDKQMLKSSRLTMLGVGIVILVLGLATEPNVFLITWFVGPLFASTWGVVGFMSVWSRRITESAAFWGIIAGFLGNVIPRTFQVLGVVDLPGVLNPILLGVLASLICVLVISARTRPREENLKFRDELHVTPEEEKDPKELRRTARAPAILAIFAVFSTVLGLSLYVKPFQLATGAIQAGESMNYFSLEAVMVYTGLIIGLLVAWLVRDDLKRRAAE